MAKKYKATPEQIAQAKKKLEQIEKESKKAIIDIIGNYKTDIGKIIEMEMFSARMYNYSMRNTALIYKQNPYSVYVQSFKKWKDMGAGVIKGSKGLSILTPVIVKGIKDDNNNFIKLSEMTAQQKSLVDNGTLKTMEFTRFKVGSVFDISQTNYPKEKYPQLFYMGRSSEEHAKLFEHLKDYAKHNLKCSIEIKDVESISLRGFYTPSAHSITISDKLDDTERLKTTAHEIGHAIMHNNFIEHTDNTYQKEIEADTFSIMFTSYCNLPIEDSIKEHLHVNVLEYVETLKNEKADISDVEICQNIENVLNKVFEVYRGEAYKIDSIIRQDIDMEMNPERQRSLSDRKTSAVTKAKSQIKNINKNDIQRNIEKS